MVYVVQEVAYKIFKVTHETWLSIIVDKFMVHKLLGNFSLNVAEKRALRRKKSRTHSPTNLPSTNGSLAGARYDSLAALSGLLRPVVRKDTTTFVAKRFGNASGKY